MYVQCRYLTNNPHHVVLENKISKISQNKFRAITNLSWFPLNPWLIPRINIQKSNFYCNGFIVKKLIYWSEHMHNRPGWRPKSQRRMSTNNDFLIEIDPDHNASPNGVEKQCTYYDTSNEFNNAMSFQDNISILHTNICSSEHKLNDFMYYINNLNIKFSFLGISETWETKHNDHLLNISNYNHEQCIRSNKKTGGGTSIYIHNDKQYKTRLDLSLPKQQYESIFIEVEPSTFGASRNTIVGEIYKPFSSKTNNFNKELEKLLIKINKERKYAVLMGHYYINTLSDINNIFIISSGATHTHLFYFTS